MLGCVRDVQGDFVLRRGCCVWSEKECNNGGWMWGSGGGVVDATSLLRTDPDEDFRRHVKREVEEREQRACCFLYPYFRRVGGIVLSLCVMSV